MLESLLTGITPYNFPQELARTAHHWAVLQSLWTNNSIHFDTTGLSWIIKEYTQHLIFDLERSVVTKKRNTIVDKYGLLGLSLLNLDDKSVILTEGVSDFFTAKLLEPNKNVLGVTTLGGSKNAKTILVNLFDTFYFCADNDVTGIKNVSNWKNFLESYSKTVRVILPATGFKDITENFMFDLKTND